MKSISLALLGLFGYAQSIQSTCLPCGGYNYNGVGSIGSGNHDECRLHKRVNYDYTCKNDYLGDALQNDITIYGPNVVLINLDNRCQVRRLEREGVFLQRGDLLFVTGREFTAALQNWDEPYYHYYDYDILFPGLDYDMPLITAPGYRQEIVVLEAVGSGKTNYNIELSWGCEVVRDVSIDVYVDQQPGLVVATPRHDCECKCDDRY